MCSTHPYLAEFHLNLLGDQFSPVRLTQEVPGNPTKCCIQPANSILPILLPSGLHLSYCVALKLKTQAGKLTETFGEKKYKSPIRILKKISIFTRFWNISLIGDLKKEITKDYLSYTTFLSAPGLLWGLWRAGLAAAGLTANGFGSMEVMYTLYSNNGLVLVLPAVVEEAEESFDLGWDASASSRLLRLLLRLWELRAVGHSKNQKKARN